MRNKIYGAFNITDRTASRYFANHPTIISNQVVANLNSYINSGDIELSSADIEPLAKDDYRTEIYRIYLEKIRRILDIIKKLDIFIA